eukprot:CAMPEP_0184294294 /NCGR_PEP_ID=MMETSP1049-20130417/5528_1 /TAXON_ID=77928 /ORGANISM="Proteomonas sulcata, Strain CCMP704" /LENGTH=41 /DNA_ID= /DNA_START= /DNA_END= /DNA_ORIENTATION=
MFEAIAHAARGLPLARLDFLGARWSDNQNDGLDGNNASADG